MRYDEAVVSVVEAVETELQRTSGLARSWMQWDRANPMAWPLIEHFALEMATRGRLSVNAIFERIRYSVAVEEFRDLDLDGFKLNNNYRAYYARLFQVLHPEFAASCTVRQLGGSAQPLSADGVYAQGDEL